MSRLFLIVVLTILVLSGLVTASAYTTALVDTGSNLSIVSTDGGALLEVAPATGDVNATNIASVSDGRIQLNFTRGTPSDVSFGFQPGGTYRFNDLVRITNRDVSSKSISLSVTSSGAAIEALASVKVGSTVLVGSGATSITIPVGESIWLDFEWTGSTETTGSVEIIVTAG
jgi:hypothetical protein